nr:MAG TPA: hypothetical protein [Crassvirales sp.]
MCIIIKELVPTLHVLLPSHHESIPCMAHKWHDYTLMPGVSFKIMNIAASILLCHIKWRTHYGLGSL